MNDEHGPDPEVQAPEAFRQAMTQAAAEARLAQVDRRLVTARARTTYAIERVARTRLEKIRVFQDAQTSNEAVNEAARNMRNAENELNAALSDEINVIQTLVREGVI